MQSNHQRSAKGCLTLALALCGLGLSGCGTVMIKTAEQPPLQTGSALKEVKPLTLCLRGFQDVRRTHRELLGNLRDKAYDVGPNEVDILVEMSGQKLRGERKFSLDKPVAEWVRESISREFQRNGHACVGPGKEGATLIVEGSVYRYSVDARFVGLSSSRLEGNVGVTLSVKAADDPNTLFTRSYDGTFYSDQFGFTVRNTIEIQNQALLSMLKELTSDAQLLAFLRQTSARP